MSVGAGLYMYDVVVNKFIMFATSSPDEFLFRVRLRHCSNALDTRQLQYTSARQETSQIDRRLRCCLKMFQTETLPRYSYQDIGIKI